MTRPMGKSRFLVAMAMVASVPAAAFEISWYQQDGPGSADGVVRLDGLDAGALTVTTPGRTLETAIKRLGNAAVVRLSGIAGAESESGELVVVATQGSTSIRESFTLAMPVIETLTATQQPPRPPAADTTVAAPSESSAVQPSIPVVAVTPVSDSPAEAPAVCPLLVVTRGSLYSTAARLLAECGHALGEWHPGDAETLVDWEVTRTRTVENADGIDGLLALLREYGLAGVIRSAGVIDIHEL